MNTFLIILSTVVYATAEKCIYLIDNAKYQRKEILNIEGLPTNLAFNNKTGQIFFTLLDIPSLLNDSVETKMDQYVIKNGVATKIGNFNGQTAIVDNARGMVFFGSNTGIYMYDDWTTSALPVALSDKDIVQLYKSPVNNDIYAVFYPSHEVYVISDGNIKNKIEDITANIVAVDKEDNLFFQNDEKGLCVLLKGFSEPISYLGLKVESGRVLAMDGERVLAATIDGLYHLRTDNVIPKKIAEFDYVPSGMYIFEDDYYTSTAGKIFKYSQNGC